MPVRLSAALGVLAVAGCLVLIVLLHAWAGLDPVWMTLSEYALGPLGWMFDTGVTCLATGSVLVLAALVRARLLRWPSVGRPRCWSGRRRCWCWCCSRRRTGRSGRA